ncbi:adhesin [Dactylosporangium sp. NPDC005555]|uniref:adhesin n=1 Tax=Dactylosporangium sp. NPDC005555 TaxID=3154889 RepID=UPI0033BC4A05
MKLTVGPLPAGVYWRRRAIIGGALLIVVLMLWVQCSGPDPKRTPTSAQRPSSAPASAPASADPTVQTPTTGDPVTSATASSSAPAVASTVPVCADGDLSLVAQPEQTLQFRGAYLKFFLKIKNTSARDCTRDLGADFQELYLQVGAIKMWSSDHCDAPKGSQPTTLKPGIEVSFSTTWNGKTTKDGCVNREVPPAGKYELVGRLDTKLSAPVQVQLS